MKKAAGIPRRHREEGRKLPVKEPLGLAGAPTGCGRTSRPQLKPWSATTVPSRQRSVQGGDPNQNALPAPLVPQKGSWT